MCVIVKLVAKRICVFRIFRNNLITINELLDAIVKLQHVSDSSKYEVIARVLDEDEDGIIDYNEALKVKIYVHNLNIHESLIEIGIMRQHISPSN